MYRVGNETTYLIANPRELTIEEHPWARLLPGELRGAGVTVLGVSPDPVKRVKRFHVGQQLNFELLADEDHAVCEAYGVWVEKSMYGRTYWGAQRSTFVIGEDGVVAHVIEKASPKTHDEEVLAAL